MDISIKHSDVFAFAGQLKNWADQMKSTQQQIISRTRQLESQWKDPQYRMFVETASNHAKLLASAIEQFETMSEQLKIMSREIEQTQRMMQQRIQQMNRR
jgi:PIN domain nuclease of toxin-antitoxin system